MIFLQSAVGKEAFLTAKTQADKNRNLSNVFDTSQVTGVTVVQCHFSVCAFTGCNILYYSYFSVQVPNLCRDTLLLVALVNVSGQGR